MKHRKIQYLLLILSLPFLQGTQCNKDVEPYPDNWKYIFKEAATLSPYQLDYHVGDTLWLRVNIPNKKLLDEATQTRILFDSALFKTYASAQLLYDDPFLGDGPFVQYIFPTGVSAFTQNYNYQTQAFIDFGCAPSNDYHLLLGIVLIKKGVLGISFNNMSIEQCSTGYAENAKLMFSFDVTDTHEQYYQQLPFASIGKQPDKDVLTSLSNKWMVVIHVL